MLLSPLTTQRELSCVLYSRSRIYPVVPQKGAEEDEALSVCQASSCSGYGTLSPAWSRELAKRVGRGHFGLSVLDVDILSLETQHRLGAAWNGLGSIEQP